MELVSLSTDQCNDSDSWRPEVAIQQQQSSRGRSMVQDKGLGIRECVGFWGDAWCHSERFLLILIRIAFREASSRGASAGPRRGLPLPHATNALMRCAAA